MILKPAYLESNEDVDQSCDKQSLINGHVIDKSFEILKQTILDKFSSLKLDTPSTDNPGIKMDPIQRSAG